MLQGLCINKKGWDDQLEANLLTQWNNIINEVAALSHIQIPSCHHHLGKKPLISQLYGVSDASKRAYAVVIYLHQVYVDGSVDLCLVSSKIRIASIKCQTIPQLEILEAVILAYLMDAVRTALK